MNTTRAVVIAICIVLGMVVSLFASSNGTTAPHTTILKIAGEPTPTPTPNGGIGGCQGGGC